MDFTNFDAWLYTVLPAAVICILLRKIPKFGAFISGAVLTVIGLVFYSLSDGNHYLVFIISVLLNFMVGRIMSEPRYIDGRDKLKKALFITGVTLDAGVLAYFKVMTFCDSNYVIPLAVSFFTFREISYLTDIYTGALKLSDNIMDDLLYLTFFPQLISGPITKYREFYRFDDREQRSLTEKVNGVTQGFRRVVVGLCKKSIFSTALANIADTAFAADPHKLFCSSAWIGAVCFSLQLYFDFSGYSDMAIGLSNVLGYSCPENFDYPYASKSVSEFWRRWHITLGHWFRDYVYIPLGGSRVKTSRTVLNLLIVWLLTGLWHGSAFSFVIWGLMHFTFIVIERFTGVSKSKKKLVLVLWRIVTLLVVVLAWVMFRAGSISHGFGYIGAMFGIFTRSQLSLKLGIQHAAMIGVSVLLSLPVVPMIKKKAQSLGKAAQAVYEILELLVLAAGCFVSAVLIANGNNNTFLYANF